MSAPHSSAHAAAGAETLTRETIESAHRLALESIARHDLPPTPENIAVWYHYALGRNAGLTRAIDRLHEAKTPFDRSVMINLHQQFLAAPSDTSESVDGALKVQVILRDVLQAIVSLTTDAGTYNANLKKYINDVSTHLNNPELKDLVLALITATTRVRERSESLVLKLAESQQDIDSMRQNLERAINESQRDFLSGMYNRKAIDRILEEQIALSNAQEKPLCVLMIDIDHFKSFNDRFGHVFGDEVIKVVAKVICNCVRGNDMAGRYGGEEFTVVLLTTPIAGAQVVAESIRNTIASHELKHRDAGENYGQITVSIGIAQLRAGVDDPVSVVKRADDALYRAKQSGRNKVVRETG